MQPVRLEGGEREPDAGAGDAEVGGELAFGGQPRAGPEARPPGLGQDHLRELAARAPDGMTRVPAPPTSMQPILPIIIDCDAS